MTINEKTINGSVAAYLMEAASHLAKLECEMAELRWRVCYRDDLHVDCGQARKRCQSLVRALVMVDLCLQRVDDDADNKVVSIEEQRKNAER